MTQRDGWALPGIRRADLLVDGLEQFVDSSSASRADIEVDRNTRWADQAGTACCTLPAGDECRHPCQPVGCGFLPSAPTLNELH
jgi:hypothetical protein